MERFTINRVSGDKNKIVAADAATGTTCTFVQGKFDETAEWSTLLSDASECAKAARTLTEWLLAEHHELLIIDMDEEVKKMRKRFGEEVAACRMAAAMDMRECAAAIGISKNHLFNIEHGRYAVTIDIMTKIAHVLDMEFVIAPEYDDEEYDDEEYDDESF